MVEMVKEMGSPALSNCGRFCGLGRASPGVSRSGALEPVGRGHFVGVAPGACRNGTASITLVVRQIAYGAALDRGRTLLELAEVLDSVVLPEAVR